LAYVSTRGGADPVGFFDALLAGLAPDGGLYVPERIPNLRPYLRENRGRLGFAGACAEALYLFAEGDLSFAGAAELAGAAFGPATAFHHPAITPLTQLDSATWLMELFHGPSLAFKDVAMQLIARLYDRILLDRGARLSVVCATSGDTGGAAASAFAGADAIDLFVLLPKGRVSAVQQRFMTATGAANVHAILVDGDFDACQALVKSLFADADFSARASLSGVNSINWARILAQTVYYIEAAFALGAGGPVDFAVPSGNFGDALAGHVARQMGAPVGRILVATNANDSLARAIASGRYQRAAASHATLSPAMDIQAASNFERLAFWALGGDGAATAAHYRDFAEHGVFTLPAKAHAVITDRFSARAIDDAATLGAMRAAFEATGEIICPHTATAVAAAQAQSSGFGANPLVILATAHPAKFPDTVAQAIGLEPPLPSFCADLFERPERITEAPADLGVIKALIAAHSRAWA
jgi:threonine synthase